MKTTLENYCSDSIIAKIKHNINGEKELIRKLDIMVVLVILA